MFLGKYYSGYLHVHFDQLRHAVFFGYTFLIHLMIGIERFSQTTCI